MKFSTRDEIKNYIFGLLKVELQDEVTYSEPVLLAKIENAINEVEEAKKYPADYSEDLIMYDMSRYVSQIRNIALYDYNQRGAEFEESHHEATVNRSYASRTSLFAGITPVAGVL